MSASAGSREPPIPHQSSRPGARAGGSATSSAPSHPDIGCPTIRCHNSCDSMPPSPIPAILGHHDLRSRYEDPSKSCHSRRRPGHPLPARHQGPAQGDAAPRGHARDPVRGGGGHPRRNREHRAGDRKGQGRHREPLRRRLRAGGHPPPARQAGGSRPRARHHPPRPVRLRAPGRAPGPRPRGAVRPPRGGGRALRPAPGRRCLRRARFSPGVPHHRLPGHRKVCRRCPGGSGGACLPLRHRQRARRHRSRPGM